jgi:uncharacterized delta-60 repeat protein
VRALALQPDGRVLIGGTFTTVAGQSRPRLARLHADGSLDTSFNPGTGANDYPRALAVLPDGKILVAGRFTTFNGAAHGRIVRLMPGGAVDPMFNAGSGADKQIRALAVLPDGRLYIGGHFESFNGTNRSTVARLFSDGGLDLSFDQGNPDNDTVQTLVAEPGGKVWIGGLFLQAGGQPRTLIAQLNADGTADPVVNLALDNQPGDEIFALALQSDGLLLMSGEFRSVNGVTRHRLARVIPPGTPPILRLTGPFPSSAPEGGEVVFTVERIGPDHEEARIDYATINGTAISGVDFTPVFGTLTFAPGETRKNLAVPLLPDAVYDPDESFALRLENPQGASLGAPASGAARIIEASPSIEFTPLEIQWQWHEGVSSNSTNATMACLGLLRTGYVPGQVWSVEYEIISGTALPGEDFTGPLTGAVDFTEGGDFRCLWIPLINDGRMEPTETFTVRLVRATGAVLTSRNVATLTIWDDDGPIGWAVNELKVPENAGQVRLEIRRNDNGPSPVTVSYTIAGATAQPGEDFLGASGSVILEPGERAAPVTVTVLDDCRIEPDKTLTVTLTGLVGDASLSTNPTARVILLDDERPGSFDPAFAPAALPSVGPPGPYATHTGGTLLAGLWSQDGRIVRLKRDGSMDETFTATNLVPPMPSVFSNDVVGVLIAQLLVLPDQRVLVRCVADAHLPRFFLTNHLLRLHWNGVLDATFQLDPRVQLPFQASSQSGLGRQLIALDSSSKVLAIGRAVMAGGEVWSEGLVRLLADGSLDLSFRVSRGLGLGEAAEIVSLAVQQNDHILVSGTFSRGGTNFSGVARLLPDGALDDTFAPARFQQVSPFGFTFDSPPRALAVQSNGAVLAAGEFNRVNGVQRTGLVRLLPDGALDLAFDPAANLPPGADGAVDSLLLDERGRIVIAGPLARALAGPRYPVARLRSDGALDTTFQMNENDVESWRRPEQLLLTDDRDIVVAGRYFDLLRLNGDAYPKLVLDRPTGQTGWRLRSPTITGDLYLLQATTDFMTWQTIATRQADGCSLEFPIPPSAGPRFFRIERLPAQ